MLKRLKIWYKLALIVAVMGTAVPVIFYLIQTRDAATIDFAQFERYGDEYMVPTRELLARGIQYRDRAALVLASNAASRNELSALRTAIDNDIAAIDRVHRLRGATLPQNTAKVPERYEALKKAWEALKNDRLDPASPSTTHTVFVTAITDFLAQVGDSSNLILDPDIDTYYLMSGIITSLPPLADDIGRMRALGASIALKRAITPEERLQLASLIGRVQMTFEAAKKGMTDSAFVYNSSLQPILTPPLTEVERQLEAMLALFTTRLTLPDTIDIPAEDVFAAGSQTLERVFNLYSGQLTNLDALIAKRIERFQQDKVYILGGLGVGVFVALLLVVLLSRTITRQTASITEVLAHAGSGQYDARARVLSGDELGTIATTLNTTLDRMAEMIQTLLKSQEERDQMQRAITKLLAEISDVATGDLTRQAEVTTDMTGAIADAFNHMIHELRGVIGSVQDTTAAVSSMAGNVRSSTEQLADGSDHQAAEITRAATAVEDIAASTRQVYENAAASATVAQQARANAERGSEVVERTIGGMNGIREQVQETAKRIKRLSESSQEVGQIVQLIGDVADRTSILALNASIQAAMAGDAGRGFAVVAEEVERLADRATEATKRIATLIKTTQTEMGEAVAAMEETTREVVAGSQQAAEAGVALNEIRTVSTRLAELIQAISVSAMQQARGSEAVAKSMGEISTVTQQTAAGTRQTAVSIRQLAGQTDELRTSLLGRFTMPENGNGNGHAHDVAAR